MCSAPVEHPCPTTYPAQSFPSPSGRFQVYVEPWEAKMSHWVECPYLEEVSSGRVLFRFPNHLWTLDSAKWLDETTVQLGLRKYPGGHSPPALWVTIDCHAETATLGGGMVSLDALAAAAEAEIHWASSTSIHSAHSASTKSTLQSKTNLLQRLVNWLKNDA